MTASGVVLDAAWDLLVGAACAGCGAPGRPWCRACRHGLAAVLAQPPARARVSPAPPGLPTVWSAGPYAGPLRDAVLAYKERGRRALARPLGAGLASALQCAAPPGAVVVAVPSSAAARRERGFDHVGLLVRHAVARGAPPSQPLLRWARRQEDQAALGTAARAANRHGALVARPCAGAVVVLVDDVVTTGATLAEAARALRAAGAEVVAAATVATTVRRGAPEGTARWGVPGGGGRDRPNGRWTGSVPEVSSGASVLAGQSEGVLEERF